jgi:hypothetical protein
MYFGTGQDAAKDEDSSWYRTMAARFVIALVFTLPVLALALGGFVPRFADILNRVPPGTVNLAAKFVFSMPMVLYASGFVFAR